MKDLKELVAVMRRAFLYAPSLENTDKLAGF